MLSATSVNIMIVVVVNDPKHLYDTKLNTFLQIKS